MKTDKIITKTAVLYGGALPEETAGLLCGIACVPGAQFYKERTTMDSMRNSYQAESQVNFYYNYKEINIKAMR